MDDRIVNRIVWGAAIVALAMFVGATFIGCSESTAPTPAWSAEYDAPWKAVCDCWGEEPSKPVVIVKDDCPHVCQGGELCFPYTYSETGWACGYYERPNRITVCADLKALRHEFSHYVSQQARGTSGHNYEGKCWL